MRMLAIFIRFPGILCRICINAYFDPNFLAFSRRFYREILVNGAYFRDTFTLWS